MQSSFLEELFPGQKTEMDETVSASFVRLISMLQVGTDTQVGPHSEQDPAAKVVHAFSERIKRSKPVDVLDAPVSCDLVSTPACFALTLCCTPS